MEIGDVGSVEQNRFRHLGIICPWELEVEDQVCQFIIKSEFTKEESVYALGLGKGQLQEGEGRHGILARMWNQAQRQ